MRIYNLYKKRVKIINWEKKKTEILKEILDKDLETKIYVPYDF